MHLIIVVLACLFVLPAYAADMVTTTGNPVLPQDQFADPSGVAPENNSSLGLGYVDGSHVSVDVSKPAQLDTLYSGLVGTLIFDKESAPLNETLPAAAASASTSLAADSIERASLLSPPVEGAFWLLIVAVCSVTLIILFRLRTKRRLR